MSEEAPVRPTADTEAASAKDGTHEEGGVSTTSDASMKGFFPDAKMIANEMAAAIATAAGDVSTKALTPSPKPVLVKKGAPVEEKIPEGPGLVTKGISVKVSTPPRGDASPTGAQTQESPLTTPPVISSSDPFTALSQEVRGGPSLVLTPSSIPVTIGSKVPEKQEVAGVLIEPTPARSSLSHAEGAQSVVMEVGNSSVIAIDLMEEVTSFFVRFEQGESNDLDLVDF